MRLPLLSAAAILLAAALTPGCTTPPYKGTTGPMGASGAWLFGYYRSQDDPVNGGYFPPSDIDWAALTHLAIAFYVPDGTGGFTSGSFNPSTAQQIISAAHANGKLVIASIGGAASGPAFETSLQKDSIRFYASLTELYTMGYDGVDIDWEGGDLDPVIDQQLQKAMLEKLRASHPNAVLTITAPFQVETVPIDLTFYGEISSTIDRINVLTYAMSVGSRKSWHWSPLHWNENNDTPTGIDATVAHYLNAGVPAGKINIGSGFYAACYSTPITAPLQLLGSATLAPDADMSYRNILSKYYSASAYHFDSAAGVPYLTLDGNNPEKCTYVSYEDPTSIALKGAFVLQHSLGGVLVWTLGGGYVSGASTAAKNPLAEALRAALKL